MRVLWTTLPLAALAFLTGYTVLMFDTFDGGAEGFFSRQDAAPFVACIALSWGLFALAVVALRRVPERLVPWLVIAGAAVLSVAALIGDPNMSTDSARYAWDGIVQLAGESPYRYVPADPALEQLRPSWLYPDPVLVDGAQRCVGERIAQTTEIGGDDVLCTALNRPQVPTIYPPLAEIYFLAVRLFVAPEVGYIAFQVAGALIVLGVTVLLLHTLRRRDLPLWWAALWGWSPFVALETVTNSHVDALGAALALLASVLVANGRRVWGGIALGGAIAVKLIPVIVAPPLIRKRPWAIIGASVATFAILYVPYVLSTGIGVLGYLPGYLTEEGYEDGTRFVLLSGVVPGWLAAPLIAAVLAVIVGVVFWRADPSAPWLSQLVIVGATLLLLSPRYAWYGLLLVPFVAMTGRWEWLAVPIALTLRAFGPPLWAFQLALVLAAVVIVVGSVLRLPKERRRTLLRRPLRFVPGARD